ncbi:MAG TPA: MFS transporter [Fimbriimonadaceae bacterium]|nr:MFS transporter [Fimbriimonadaceae bacterium]
MNPLEPAEQAASRVPRTVVVLGFVSLLMDFSSELVHSVLPVFLVTSLGASSVTVGLIEGVGEATSQIVKVFSGAISDFVGKRKVLLMAGYGLAALTKPLFPLAGSADVVFLARVLDRVGKGIRGAPRDALVADVTPPDVRGAAFGLRQSMDTVGAILGPVAAILLMVLLRVDLRRAMWFAVIPAVLCFGLILAAVKEPPHRASAHRFRNPIHVRELRRFGFGYWWVVGFGFIFTLSRFSEAFLVLRGRQAGLSLAWTPLVMATMSVTYALSAYPAGIWSDRVPRVRMLGASLLPLLLADLVLARSDSVVPLLVGVGLWGIHMGFSQGVLSALVADSTAPDLKGTAFGVFNLACGIAMLVSNGLAGWVWQAYGSASTFYVGAVLTAGTLLFMLLRRFRSAA